MDFGNKKAISIFIEKEKIYITKALLRLMPNILGYYRAFRGRAKDLGGVPYPVIESAILRGTLDWELVEDIMSEIILNDDVRKFLDARAGLCRRYVDFYYVLGIYHTKGRERRDHLMEDIDEYYERYKTGRRSAADGA